MIIWIAALVLVAIGVALGYRQGAIRTSILFVGLLVAAFFATTLAKWFEFPFRFINVHPAVPAMVSPLLAFVAVMIVFGIVAGLVHKKADYHYRYHVPDAVRAFWERLNSRVGACVGALNGLVYFLVFATAIHVYGYPISQVGGAESNSKVLSFIGNAAEDLQATEMTKVTASFNPAPKKYYDVSDILGLVYHNRSLVNRLQSYPYFAAMEDRPAFQAMAGDRELQGLLRRSSTLAELLENAKIYEAVTNKDLYAEYLQVDVEDLETYLNTGHSPKYSQEPILGHWAYSLNETLKLNKAKNPEIGAGEWARMKAELSERFARSMFSAFYDHKARLRLTSSMEGAASKTIPVPVAVGRTNQVPIWHNPAPSYSAAGKWSGSAPNYLITLGNQNGTATSEAKLESHRISFQFEGKTLSYEKRPD